MIKIGILTYHYAINYGAVLQAYALREMINSFEGYEVEIINYIPDGYVYYPYEYGVEGRDKFKEKRNKFGKFITSYLNVKEKVEHVVDGYGYDYICVGSDQVWNVALRENVDLEYFLPNINNNTKCISYAASIGTNVNEINIDLFRNHLAKFQSISLREDEGYQEFIKNKCFKECEIVLDPTLLLNSENFESLMSVKERFSGRFIFFFWYDNDDNLYKVAEFVNMLSRMYSIPIVHSVFNAPQYLFTENSQCMMYEGVEDFLWYLKNAEYVVTNSFHGLALSILFEKKLYIYIAELRRSRLDNLVKMFGLENRVIDHYILAKEIDWDINYDEIKKRLNIERMKSIDYLRSAINAER